MMGADPAALFDLKGRTAIVTGASSGLGVRFAEVLAAAGAAVALTARRKPLLDDHCARLRANGARAIAVEMDVTDEASVIAAYDEVERTLGPIDTAIANAGIAAGGRSTEMAMDDFRRVLEVDISGVFLTAREAARRMMAGGSRSHQRGRIVLIASAAAHTPVAGLAAYNAAKAGVAMLGRSLAVEWVRQGINVNVLCPGFIATDINHALFSTEAGRRQVEGFARRRLMSPEDLDGAMLYFCADSSRAVTGSVLAVDDGQSG